MGGAFCDRSRVHNVRGAATRSRQGKFSVSDSWIEALLPVARFSLDAFRQELSKLGWIEGKNIAIEYRFAEQKPERLPELAAELVRLKVDLIMIAGAPAALAAKKVTTTIPIVMASSGDPLSSGLVESLARPGGNITGLSALSAELGTKRLEVLRDAIPKVTRVALSGRGPASNPN